MPALGAIGPADLDARARAELGYSHQLQQPRRVAPDPSRGGGRGYDVFFRQMQLNKQPFGVAW